MHVFTRSHAAHPISHAKKKSDFGHKRVRSISNSPTVDSAKERICNAGFTPGAEAPLVVHLGCDAPRRYGAKACTDGFGVESIFCARRERIATGNTLKKILNDINDIFYMI